MQFHFQINRHPRHPTRVALKSLDFEDVHYEFDEQFVSPHKSAELNVRSQLHRIMKARKPIPESKPGTVHDLVVSLDEASCLKLKLYRQMCERNMSRLDLAKLLNRHPGSVYQALSLHYPSKACAIQRIIDVLDICNHPQLPT